MEKESFNKYSDETEARAIEQHVIQKNQYHLFTPAKIKRASPQ